MPAELESAMHELAREELVELKRKGYEFLDGLPIPYRRETKLAGKKVRVTIWREAVADWQVRVVVQIEHMRWFGRRGIRVAHGFRMTDQGGVTDITNEEMRQFL